MASYALGMSEFTTWPWTFERDVEQYAALGIECIEVCEFKLDPTRMQDQLATIGGAGLTISSIQPLVRTLYPSISQPEPHNVGERMERFKESIRLFGSHGEGVAFVTNTGIPPGGNIQEVVDVAASRYRELADFAADHGALIALEPLNPSIMNIESAIWTLEQAMRIVAAVRRDNFGICLDFWNIWQNPGIEDAIRACGQILVVQVSDWRTPRSTQDRAIPGDGEIPMGRLIAATRDSGFTGPYSIEIFSGNVPDALWEADLVEVIEASRRGFDAAWEASSPFLAGRR